MPTAHQVSTTLEVSPDAGRTTGGDAVRRGPSRDPQELLEGLNGPQVAAVTHTTAWTVNHGTDIKMAQGLTTAIDGGPA